MAAGLEIGVRLNSKRFKSAEKGIRALANKFSIGVNRLTPTLKKELKDYLDAVALALVKRHGTPYPGGTSATTLSRRSGKGIRSIKRSIKVKGRTISTVTGTIGARKELAIHERGGRISAKNVKYLTIPLDAALRPNGTPKRRSSRQWDRTFVQRSKNGHLLIFQRRGRSIIPLYLLRRSVEIPPRLGMEDTLRKTRPTFVESAVSAMLAELQKQIDK